jgi:hypothetical protein
VYTPGWANGPWSCRSCLCLWITSGSTQRVTFARAAVLLPNGPFCRSSSSAAAWAIPRRPAYVVSFPIAYVTERAGPGVITVPQPPLSAQEGSGVGVTPQLSTREVKVIFPRYVRGLNLTWAGQIDSDLANLMFATVVVPLLLKQTSVSLTICKVLQSRAGPLALERELSLCKVIQTRARPLALEWVSIVNNIEMEMAIRIIIVIEIIVVAAMIESAPQPPGNTTKENAKLDFQSGVGPPTLDWEQSRSYKVIQTGASSLALGQRSVVIMTITDFLLINMSFTIRVQIWPQIPNQRLRLEVTVVPNFLTTFLTKFAINLLPLGITISVCKYG